MSIKNLTFLVFSPSKFTPRLKAAFNAALKNVSPNEKYKDVVEIKFSETVDGLFENGISDALVDFVIVFVDSANDNCVSECQSELSKISVNLTSTRFCLVNGSCRSGLLPVTKDLFNFAEHLKLPLVNMEVGDDMSCKIGAEKLVKLGTLSTGVTFGVPVLIPAVGD